MCSEGIENPSASWLKDEIIDNVEDLRIQIEEAFAHARWPCETKCALMKILSKVDFRTEELNKYTYWDKERPYTRNLICTDNKNYTLLLLCWNSQRESKIHNHPCDGCYVKCVRGMLRETRYTCNAYDNTITKSSVKFYSEGQVSYMCDEMGLHKIGNSDTSSGAVSLHLYTPPFKTCKCWATESCKFDDAEIGVVGYFSYQGVRTPHLEGRAVRQKVLEELRQHSEEERNAQPLH